ncbi:MAG: hypothetical protein ACRD21_13015 [Vicinamibacteria bacterium]
MLKTAALILLSIPLLLAGLIASTGIIVVDVKTADGPHIIVPVPMLLARTALGFVPREATHIEIPELSEYSDVASRLVAELRESGDGILIEVDDRNDHVVIEKIGDEIAIEVSTDDEEVSIHVPLAAASELLEGYDGETFQLAGALSALSSGASLTGTNLVHVKSDEEEVKIWVW